MFKNRTVVSGIYYFFSLYVLIKTRMCTFVLLIVPKNMCIMPFVFGFHMEECHIIKCSGFYSNCFHVLCVHSAVEGVDDNAGAKLL